MSKIKCYVIDEVGEILTSYEEAVKTAKEEYKLDTYTISEYLIEPDVEVPLEDEEELRDWEKQYNLTEKELIPMLKEEGYSKSQIEEIIVALDLGATMDAALQQFFM